MGTITATFTKPVSPVNVYDYEIDVSINGSASESGTVDSMTLTLKQGGNHLTTIYTGNSLLPDFEDGAANLGSYASIIVFHSYYQLSYNTEYELHLYADDGMGDFLEQSYFFTTISNATPTDIILSNNTIAENNSSGDSIGTLSTVDIDGGIFTYTLVSGDGDADNASFTIDGNTLKAAEVFDFEAKETYNIRLRSTDSGSLYTEKQFTISITDIDEAPPVIDQISPARDASDVSRTPEISFRIQDNVEVNWSTLVVTIKASSVTPSVNEATGVVTITGQSFDYSEPVNITVAVDDTVGNTLNDSWQFTVLAGAIIDEVLDIDGGTSSFGSETVSAIVNAEVSISGGGSLTLIGATGESILINAPITAINGTLTFSGESVTIDAPIIVESDGTIVFESGADMLSNTSLSNITIKPGGGYVSKGRARTIRFGTALEIKRER